MIVESMQPGKLLLDPCASRKQSVYSTEGREPHAKRRPQLLSEVLNNGGTGCLLPLCTIESYLTFPSPSQSQTPAKFTEVKRS